MSLILANKRRFCCFDDERHASAATYFLSAMLGNRGNESRAANVRRQRHVIHFMPTPINEPLAIHDTIYRHGFTGKASRIYCTHSVRMEQYNPITCKSRRRISRIAVAALIKPFTHVPDWQSMSVLGRSEKKSKRLEKTQSKGSHHRWPFVKKKEKKKETKQNRVYVSSSFEIQMMRGLSTSTRLVPTWSACASTYGVVKCATTNSAVGERGHAIQRPQCHDSAALRSSPDFPSSPVHVV